MKTLLLSFLFLFNLFICQQKQVPSYTPPLPHPNYYLNNGNINLTIPKEFIKTPVKGEIYDSFSPMFKLHELPMPTDLYALQRSNSDAILFMFTKTNTDYNIGLNENLSKEHMDLILDELKPLGNKGTMESIKMNGFNIIKHSYTVNSLRTTMYYLYDLDEMLFFFTVYAGNISAWEKVEQKILSSFERKKSNSKNISYYFFDLKFYLDQNAEFTYGKDAVNKMSDLFSGMDKLAEKAGIKEHINSKQLSNSARIFLKNVGGIMIFAKNIDSGIKNSEMLNNPIEIEDAKKFVDEIIDNDVPRNIDIIKSNKAEKYISKNGVCFIIKEVTVKKTDLLDGKIIFDNSLFIELFHRNKWYSIVGSYQNEQEKSFIYQIINDIEVK